MSEIYATANFRLSGEGNDGEPYEATVEATLEKSGAFDYGNGTCMILKWSTRNRPEYFDTRYSKVSAKNFTEFAKEQIEAMVLDTIKVETI